MSKRKFKWSVWDYDSYGDAYIISKDECPNREDVPDFICKNDFIHTDCKNEMKVEEGWCSWQVRSDWFNLEGNCGSYCVENQIKRPNTKNKWFPVWIVRCEEWY